MQKVSRALWFTAGLLFLGIAYIGVVTPGIPWSTPSVVAAFCFARSNDKWYQWLMNHKLFGAFLSNWQQNRIFPQRAKWAMVISMDISLIILWFTTGNVVLCLTVAAAMLVGGVWAWRYPGSIQEYQNRIAQGRKIGWLK